jgi:hypothetical protein
MVLLSLWIFFFVHDHACCFHSLISSLCIPLSLQSYFFTSNMFTVLCEQLAVNVIVIAPRCLSWRLKIFVIVIHVVFIQRVIT